tara:strand:+ start:691 stop:1350 length:660 start_codon:yes stop_codon:yes gene_type:complete
MHIKLPGLVGLLVISFTCFTATADCNDEANEARLDNRLEESEIILADCLNDELERLARTYLLLGLTHYDNGNHRKAIKQYTKALETVPGYVTALANRGLSYSMSGKIKKALKDFDAAIEIDPQYMRAYYYRAFALEKDRREEEAIRDYSVALQIAQTDDDKKRILYRRGVLNREIDQFDSAMSDFDAAIALDPGYVDVYFSRALAFQHSDQNDAAMAEY